MFELLHAGVSVKVELQQRSSGRKALEMSQLPRDSKPVFDALSVTSHGRIFFRSAGVP
ncbi:hypothetical protein [Rhizobium leguminosarum]|uniref:hypothetical protein n=1 Tax=Rhizobium leguminosarum TaxID=384 RepID=UPI001AE1FFB5|nr:hypothetical protein [Rhizobium leguminosarum]MBP2448900.1 hypothetical protein [Rhizobium leguminosarum]